jgi:speckle-type POZ protein
MEIACTILTDVVRSVRLLKVNGYSLTRDMHSSYYYKSRWNVDGYEWEIRIYPRADYWDRVTLNGGGTCVELRLIFLSEPRAGAVRTTLRSCFVDPRGISKPSREDHRLLIFKNPKDTSSHVHLMGASELAASGYVKDDSFTVQCTLEVLKELPDIAAVPPKQLHLPSSNLHQHFAQLLQSQTGADITFLVSGESFAAHKLILAARSPVFMAEFFGDMKEKSSQSVEIEDMEAAVFKVLLQFIYTDTVPEFGQQEAADSEAIYTDTVPEFEFEQLGEADAKAATVMAQHLLAAADRYGLDRLKLICAGELTGSISVDTAATTLALAEQHNCPELKERCVEFIITTSTTLDAVLLTEGYKHLEASCPLVVIDLLKAARGRK